MKTSFKIALASLAGFVIGGVAGFFVHSNNLTADSAKGDIAKVSRFSRNVVSPAMSAFQEKVTSDTTEFNKAKSSLLVLTSRMTEFNELVTIASAVSEGKEELASSLERLTSIKQLASNARDNGIQAIESLNAIGEGRKTSVDYEQAAQNLALAYLMVDRQMNVGKQYVSDVDAFLRGKNIEEYAELALSRELWAGYCAGEAVLNGDSEELDYWRKRGSLINEESEALSAVWQQGFIAREDPQWTILQECWTIDKCSGLISDDQLRAGSYPFMIIFVSVGLFTIEDNITLGSDFILGSEQRLKLELESAYLSGLEGVVMNFIPGKWYDSFDYARYGQQEGAKSFVR